MPRLIFQIGDGRTMEFDLSAAVVTLVRSTSNDIVINNSWISGHHAKFERSGGTIEVMNLGTLHGIPLKEFKRVGGVYTVVDMDSHNGVMVNGKRVSSQQLSSGDRLAFGQLEAIFEEAPAPATIYPLPADQPAASLDQSTLSPAAGHSRDRSPPAAPSEDPDPLPTEAPFAKPRLASPVPVVTQRLVKPPPVPKPPEPATPRSTTPAVRTSAEEQTSGSASIGPWRPLFAPPAQPADSSPSREASRPDSEPNGHDGSHLPSEPPIPPRTVNHQEAIVMTPRAALATLQRDVALLEETLSALPEARHEALNTVQPLARGLIQRIDQLEDLMVAGEKVLPGLAARLEPFHASLVQLLLEHGIERYTVSPGQPLDVATRKRITIVEPAPEGEGVTEIAEVFRQGYQCLSAPGTSTNLIVRKAEVRTARKSPANR